MSMRRVTFLLCGVLSAVFLISAPAISAVNKNDAEILKGATTSPVTAKGNSCVQCHKSLKGKPGAVVAEWEQSVHGKKGKNCTICHGGNPEALDSKLAKSKEYNFIGKPAKKNITEFCGREECHKVAYEQFKRSPHYQSVMKRGDPNCVSCHGSHNVQRSSINIISDTTCSDCHSPNYSREIISSIFSIEKDIHAIEKKIEILQKRKADVGVVTEGLGKTRHLFHQMVHVFSREDIQFTKKILELDIKSLNDDISSKLNVVRRLDFIYIFTIILSFSIIMSLAVYVVWMLSKRKK